LNAGTMSPPKPPPAILAGALSLDTIWTQTFPERASALLQRLPPEERLDLGCALRHGAFEVSNTAIHFSQPDEALICFFLSFLRRLQQLGTAPAIDLAEYSRTFGLGGASYNWEPEL
jgi:hypothetical protein